MTTDKRSGQDDQINPGSQAEARSLIALEQSALYAARLAIARWSSSSAISALPVVAPDPAASRASWYAKAQQNFQEWLGRGGFAQYDLACAPSADAPDSGALDSAAQPTSGLATRRAPTCIN